jgi:aspartate dehydrogenase
VVLTTRKHPSTLLDVASTDAPAPATLASAQVVFEGNAVEAVRRFPFNINVAATLSLAGLGPERTMVRIIADPDAKGNTHEIYARGKSGVLRFTMENVPHPDNPRTSHLAALSAIETLRSACAGGLRLGA